MLNKLGRYQILRELGRGAAGVVYHGFDPTIGRTVAIKTLHLENRDPETLKRFRREAKAAGVLSHPNIVTIYDAGEEEGLFYIAMEYVEGDTLQEMVARGPLAVERALSVVEQVGAALDHAHEHEIVHRDIKSSNVMLAKGVAKVLDFGVARVSSLGMTLAGAMMGTLFYMSPEMVKGLEIDHRTDIFSLGVLFYEMVTGKKPFTGDSMPGVMFKIITDEAEPPSKLQPQLHPGLDLVVLKALAKKPVDRYGKCSELSAACRTLAAAIFLRNLRARGEQVRMEALARKRAADPSTGSVELSPSEIEGLLEGLGKPPAPTRHRATGPPPAPPPPVVGPVATPPPSAEERLGSGTVLMSAAEAEALLTAKPDAGRPSRPAAESRPAADAVQPPTVPPQPASPPQSPPTATPPPAAELPAAPAPPVGGTPQQGPPTPPPARAPLSWTSGTGRTWPSVRKTDPSVEEVPTPTLPGPAERVPAEGNPQPASGEVEFVSGMHVVFQVSANVEGAAVRLDGTSIPEWLTPCRMMASRGPHQIEVSKPGYRTETRVVSFSAEGPRLVEFDLVPDSPK